jgi:hypothetical protein
MEDSRTFTGFSVRGRSSRLEAERFVGKLQLGLQFVYFGLVHGNIK